MPYQVIFVSPDKLILVCPVIVQLVKQFLDSTAQDLGVLVVEPDQIL
jgi:hypothetical protein